MRQTLSVAICVIVSLVVLAIATRYVHPHWMLATLHSLQLHAAAACVAAMLFSLLLSRNLLSYVLLIASLCLVGHALYIGRELASEPTAAEAAGPGFRLMSFNIMSDNYQNGPDIAEAITASGADVVNVMEAEPLLGSMDKLAATYPYRIGCGVMVADCDQLMLSKVPLMNGVVRSLSGIFDNRFIMADVTLQGRTVHVGGIHTTKPYFDNFHRLELMRAALAITDTDGPLVLSGDFNASSLTPDMLGFLQWTGLRTAAREQPTWPVRLKQFGMPIDHVFVRAPLKIRTLTRMPDNFGSNHAGLIADIVFTGQ